MVLMTQYVSAPYIDDLLPGTPNEWAVRWTVQAIDLFPAIDRGKASLAELAGLFLGQVLSKLSFGAGVTGGTPQILAEVTAALMTDDRLFLALPVAVINFYRYQNADGALPLEFVVEYDNTGKLAWIAGLENETIQAGD
jgi:hypothetical protein